MPYNIFMKDSCTSVFLVLFLVLGISACGGVDAPPPSLTIDRIQSTPDAIDPVNPQPAFTQFFSTGATVIYTYVFLSNTETMTGSFSVRLRWFFPNDLRPPIAQHVLELQPGQNIAQFSLHNEDGLRQGPYQLIARAGKNPSELTASGSSRFFIGMSPDEAQNFLDEEAEFMRQREEVRRKQEEERKKQEEEDRLNTQSDSGEFMPEDLPPVLTDGAGDE
jgi:hypothetical protein